MNQGALSPDNDGDFDGVLHVLESVAVVTSGPIVGFQEGIIDMSGPGAKYTPFSQKLLVSLQIQVRNDVDQHQHEEAVRRAGIRAAEYLGKAVLDLPSSDTEIMEWRPLPETTALPKIAYVYMLLSQGLLHDNYVRGSNSKEGLPIVADPRLGMTGGIVSGNCVSACDKNATWFHQNNPVVDILLRGHGNRWNFVGMVITNEPTRLSEKQNSASKAVQLTRELAAAGAVISKEGFGNPDCDLMMIVRGLESSGIRTTLLTDEFAGVDGGSQSLADTTKEADAVVSVGNANEPIRLPPMENVIGNPPDIARLAGGYPWSRREDGTLEIEIQAILGATNPLGYGSLSCRPI